MSTETVGYTPSRQDLSQQTFRGDNTRHSVLLVPELYAIRNRHHRNCICSPIVELTRHRNLLAMKILVPYHHPYLLPYTTIKFYRDIESLPEAPAIVQNRSTVVTGQSTSSAKTT